MQQIVIATRKRGSRDVIEALQDAGALHLVPVQGGGVLSAGPLTGEDAEFRRESERLLARAETTLTELGAVRRVVGHAAARGRSGPPCSKRSLAPLPSCRGGGRRSTAIWTWRAPTAPQSRP